ncbi:MAG: cytochrome-c peroxidase [Bacteroidia bacterium]|nr:cytochrome-c peroxidase [Bacteroidia bacterium]
MGCKKPDSQSTPVPSPEGPVLPAGFPKVHYNNPNNPWSEATFQLGRKLFYDPILSEDSTVACASCHHQGFAFSDAGMAFSLGIRSQLGNRNAPSIQNVLWQTSFMWDGGINHIEIMPFGPITNPVEMGESLPLILTKLNRSHYRAAFRTVFRQDSINSQQLFYALTQFLGNLISASSRYDQFRKGAVSFTESELSGYRIFQQRCNSCHTEPLFTNYTFQNNGIDTVFADEGRKRISLESSDLGKFKVPTLRNIAVTYPYMHDGRFWTLEQVIAHYNQPHVSFTVSRELLNKPALSALEQQQLLSFLHTLTDTIFLQNSRFSKPN